MRTRDLVARRAVRLVTALFALAVGPVSIAVAQPGPAPTVHAVTRAGTTYRFGVDTGFA